MILATNTLWFEDKVLSAWVCQICKQMTAHRNFLVKLHDVFTIAANIEIQLGPSPSL